MPSPLALNKPLPLAALVAMKLLLVGTVPDSMIAGPVESVVAIWGEVALAAGVLATARSPNTRATSERQSWINSNRESRAENLAKC